MIDTHQCSLFYTISEPSQSVYMNMLRVNFTPFFDLFFTTRDDIQWLNEDLL